jgi:hypothetical protein
MVLHVAPLFLKVCIHVAAWNARNFLFTVLQPDVLLLHNSVFKLIHTSRNLYLNVKCLN